MCACPACDRMLLTKPAVGERLLRDSGPAVAFWRGADLAGFGETIASDLASAMPDYRVADYFRAKPDIVGSQSGVVLATDRETGRVVALLVATRHSIETAGYVSLDTILVAQQYQRTTLSARMLTCLVKGMATSSLELPSFLMLTTGNPTSYCMASSFIRLADARVYPRITGDQDPGDASLAATLAKIHRPLFSFCKRTGVLAGGAGSVPPDFYPQVPISRNREANAYFARHLGPSDRLMCLMIFPDTQAKVRLWKFLVREERTSA